MLLAASTIGLCLASATTSFADKAGSLADTYVSAIEKTNRDHQRKPRDKKEDDLRLPKKAATALERLLSAKESDGLADALIRAAGASLDLARVDDFDLLRERLGDVAPERVGEVGVALARPRYLLIGENGLDAPYLERFALVLDEVLAGYDELFGFEEWSKLPGKKLRVRLHLEEKITRPPHFAPQYAYHSEVDFPVNDAKEFTSPTQDGKFLFYGLCHELGHVIAMWGDTRNEEDHHAWAHYTGVLLVEHLSAKGSKTLEKLRDVRWRSLAEEEKRLAAVEPSLENRDGVLKTLIQLHHAVGPKALGAAINHLDEEDRRLRVNLVRYYSFRDLARGLEKTLKDKAKKKVISDLLP